MALEGMTGAEQDAQANEAWRANGAYVQAEVERAWGVYGEQAIEDEKMAETEYKDFIGGVPKVIRDTPAESIHLHANGKKPITEDRVDEYFTNPNIPV
jgi:hypothetical protein